MNTYRVSYTTQGLTGKINKWDSKVIAASMDEAAQAVIEVYSDGGAQVAVTQVEAIALTELF